MDVIRRNLYHIFHPIKTVGQLVDVGHEGFVDSVYDSGNAQIGSGDAIVRVETTNFIAITRHERAVQGELAGEEQ